jgi:hypothetical protein
LEEVYGFLSNGVKSSTKCFDSPRHIRCIESKTKKISSVAFH